MWWNKRYLRGTTSQSDEVNILLGLSARLCQVVYARVSLSFGCVRLCQARARLGCQPRLPDYARPAPPGQARLGQVVLLGPAGRARPGLGWARPGVGAPPGQARPGRLGPRWPGQASPAWVVPGEGQGQASCALPGEARAASLAWPGQAVPGQAPPASQVARPASALARPVPGQVVPGQPRPGQLPGCIPASGCASCAVQARLVRCQARPGCALPEEARPGKARPGQARPAPPGQAARPALPARARPGQARPGPAPPGQAKRPALPGQARPGQVVRCQPGQARGQARPAVRVRPGQARARPGYKPGLGQARPATRLARPGEASPAWPGQASQARPGGCQATRLARPGLC
ncbi:spidroin-2-like [Penaeus japonicus]|uniref:spidroin-2-like n=1 Tax=Penaeus japonicus TaxID=27405 RepID=UPI001C716753|nr:spidroin-2-like [Penaeus japonicus]